MATVLDAEINVSCDFEESLSCGYTKGDCWQRYVEYATTYGEPPTTDVSIIIYLLRPIVSDCVHGGRVRNIWGKFKAPQC